MADSQPTVGIVGANGQVGTELCFILRESRVRPIPIVRNSVGAATFDHYGFDVRIADVGDLTDANEALSDLDAVVVAAFASPISRGNFTPRQSRAVNERLARNSVRAASDVATVIYFSSVAAFGRELDVSENWWYVREKRNVETAFKEECELHDCDGYIHRIGLVLGQNLDRTESIESRLASSGRIDVEASATAASNTVHTVSIADAILACIGTDTSPGTYTIVNKPQWTWRQVFEHYRNPDTDTEIQFVGSRTGADSTIAGELLSTVTSHAAGRKTEIMSIGVFLPDIVNQFAFNKYMQKEIGGEISNYQDRFRFHRREFDYAEAPGPTVPGTKSTETRLQEWNYPPEIFE
jgi:dTDP-4-dehydrorhamnose reductase